MQDGVHFADGLLSALVMAQIDCEKFPLGQLSKSQVAKGHSILQVPAATPAPFACRSPHPSFAHDALAKTHATSTSRLLRQHSAP